MQTWCEMRLTVGHYANACTHHQCMSLHVVKNFVNFLNNPIFEHTNRAQCVKWLKSYLSWADANHSIFAYGFPIMGPITLEIYKTITCSKIILYMNKAVF